MSDILIGKLEDNIRLLLGCSIGHAMVAAAQVTHYEGRKFFIISYHNDPEDPLQDNLPHLGDLPEPSSRIKCAIFEVGEVGGTYRWWRGVWTLDDVKKVAGPSATHIAHQNVINVAVDRFIGGNSSLANLSKPGAESQSTQTETQTELQASRGPDSLSVNTLQIVADSHAATINITLSELTAAQAVVRGSQLLFAIASQVAENHKASIFPSLKREVSKDAERTSKTGETSPVGASKHDPALQKQVEYLTSELNKFKKEEAVPAPVIEPGRSLGNPTKKARKVEVLEFADDSEEEKPVKTKKQKKRA